MHIELNTEKEAPILQCSSTPTQLKCFIHLHSTLWMEVDKVVERGVGLASKAGRGRYDRVWAKRGSFQLRGGAGGPGEGSCGI